MEFGQERPQTSEKENNDTLDLYLNIDNLPEGGLQLKVVYKTISGNVFPATRRLNVWYGKYVTKTGMLQPTL